MPFKWMRLKGAGAAIAIVIVLILIVVAAVLALKWEELFVPPSQIMDKARENISNVKSGRFAGTLEFDVAGQTGKVSVDSEGDLNKSKEGDFKASLDITANIMGMSGSGNLEVMAVGENAYLKVNEVNLPPMPQLQQAATMINAMKGQWWKSSRSTLFKQPPEQQAQSAKVKELEDLIKNTKFYKEVQKLGTEDVDGVSCYHYKIIPDPKALVNFISELSKLAPEGEKAGPTPEELAKAEKVLTDASKNMNIEVWVGKKDKYFHRFLFALKDYEAKPEPPAQGPSVKINNISIDLKMSKLNESVNLEEPKDAKDLSGMGMPGGMGTPPPAPPMPGIPGAPGQ